MKSWKKVGSRTQFTQLSGVLTSYQSRDCKRYLDISELKTARYMTPDAAESLYTLRDAIHSASGELRLTDVYRTWNMQCQANEDYKRGKRKAPAAPPGHSFHFAGRAIDIDVSTLNFSGQKQEQWIETFWKISKPLGWRPIINKPDIKELECWHFEYPGHDWSKAYDTMSNGHVAQCASLDAGQWDMKAKPEMYNAMSLQSQLNRLYGFCRVDGIIGPATSEMLVKANLNASDDVNVLYEQLIKKK